MDSERLNSPQIVPSFRTAALASRRIAGVAAAARTARDLIQRGTAEVGLVIEDGGTLDAAAWRDVKRLCGDVLVTILSADHGSGPVLPAPVITAREVLLATGKSSDGLISTVLNRPVSRFCSAQLLKLPGVKPAHATLGTGAIAIVMFATLVFGGPSGLIAGALLFQGASIFDGVDGEIARATFRVSPAGASLDSAVDILTNLLFVLGLTVNLTLRDGALPAALGIWSLCLLAIGFWLIGRRSARDDGPLRFEWLKQHVRRHSEGAAMSRIAWLATFLTTRDSIAFFFMMMTLAGLAMPALCVLALAATIWIGVLIASLVAARHGAATISGPDVRHSET
jgi:phosphatidylglycerophosphate synthase